MNPMIYIALLVISAIFLHIISHIAGQATHLHRSIQLQEQQRQRQRALNREALRRSMR